MDQQNGGEQGFTLIEVMIALTVLVITTVTASLALMSTDHVESFNQQRAQATQVLASQLEKDDSVAQNTAWTAAGPSGLPTTTFNVDGNQITVSLQGGWCEQTSSGTWTAYNGYVAPSPPAPPAPGTVSVTNPVIGYPMAWKEVATARWGHGQMMQLSNMVPAPANQPVQPTSSGSCPS